jgi:hypothetical protein
MWSLRHLWRLCKDWIYGSWSTGGGGHGLFLRWEVDYTVCPQVQHGQRAQVDSIPSQDVY